MVFGLGKKDSKLKEEDAPAAVPTTATSTVVAQPPSLSTLASKPDAQADPYATDPILSQMPRPSSVFEFGPLVQVGQEYMRGVCTGDDPDAIQACTWTIEEAQGKPKEKKHVYRVEF